MSNFEITGPGADGSSLVTLIEISSGGPGKGTVIVDPDGLGVSFGGSIGILPRLSIVAGQLATGQNALSVTGTLASSAVTETGISVTITGAGSTANTNQGLLMTLAAGYTGSSFSSVISVVNSSAGTGVLGFVSGASNRGILSNASGTTIGNNVGVSGRASLSSSLNLGVVGNALFSNNGAILNVGTAGLALNATVNVGGFFGLMSTAPTLGTTCALICDNGAVAADIFEARDNGTPVFSIQNGGPVLLTSTLTVDGGTGKTFISTNAAATPATTPGVVITNFYGSSATNYLGDPNIWELRKVAGTEYKFPGYL